MTQHVFEAIFLTAIGCFGVYIVLMGHPNAKNPEVTNGEENNSPRSEETDLIGQDVKQ